MTTLRSVEPFSQRPLQYVLSCVCQSDSSTTTSIPHQSRPTMLTSTMVTAADNLLSFADAAGVYACVFLESVSDSLHAGSASCNIGLIRSLARLCKGLPEPGFSF